MPSARKKLVSLSNTPYYHCVSRCVRRAFLCGKDKFTGHCFEHRRQWIEDRIALLASVFSIDVAAYAIMSNHYHIVLHVDSDQAINWSEHDVIKRWHTLFKGNIVSQRYLDGALSSSAERLALSNIIETWRKRLFDISWFMRCLNEPIAREANQEDNVTGRFWEGRFTSQALLDEKALASCLVYVDLNPIRAKMAKTPEQSSHTSIRTRIQYAQQSHCPARIDQQPNTLMPFAGWPRKDSPKGLPFRLQDYIELTDWTCRMMHPNKRGSIETHLPPILTRLNLGAKNWLYLTQNFESPFKQLVGAAYSIRKACSELNKNWAHGVSSSERLFSEPP